MRYTFAPINTLVLLAAASPNTDTLTHLLAGAIATGAEELLDELYGSGGTHELVGVAAEPHEPWGDFARRTYPSGVAIAFAPDEGELTVFVEGRFRWGERAGV